MQQTATHSLVAESRSAAADSAALVLRAQAAALSQRSLQASATAFCAELATSLGCDRVSTGLHTRGRLEIVATSQGHELQPRRDAAMAIAAAMHEALDQSRSICMPVPDNPSAAGHDVPVMLAHQLLVASTGNSAGGAMSVPLKGISAVMGAMTLERSASPFGASELALCEDLACFIGPVLELKQQAEMPWWRRITGGAREAWQGRSGPGIKLAVGGVVAVLLAATLVPLSWRVSAPARLEGSVQRAIVASADGFLQQANVRAGDTVREGQVLAEMASQDLQLERRRRESELAQHENAFRGAHSRNDRAQMVISQSRAGEAQALLSLIDTQIERSRITAPFDGIIIKGDLSQNLGAPVQRGEVLLTIAPNESFRIIVEVDESDIAAIAPGQRGRLALAAMPDRPLDVVVRRIVPVATSADARTYFEVEASLETRGVALRPGLRGVAKIEAGERSLLWILSHRMTDWLRLAFWSIGF